MATCTRLERKLARAVQRLSSPEIFRFRNGETIVDQGRFVADSRVPSYAAVPLCVITRGAISIIENGKAVKHLHTGESFGLFETAYALRFGKNERVGRWSLVADGSTDVVPLDFSHVKPFADDITSAAIESHVPKPLTRLPVLDAFAASHGPRHTDDTVLIYHSHLLDSTYDLLKHLGSVFGYQNIFVLEKPYSTIDGVFMKIARTGIRAYTMPVEKNVPYESSVRKSVDFVWSAAIHHAQQNGVKKIIALSDGGDLLAHTPWSSLNGLTVVGVEQTQRGLERIRGLHQVPVIINVAGSIAKKKHETPYIARAVCEKLASLDLLGKGYAFGILGGGAVGAALCSYLKKKHERFLRYDKDASRSGNTKSLEHLVESSDIIIGATGTDALRGLYIERLRKTKIAIVSAGSSNIEFAFLFDLVKQHANAFDDVILPVSKNLRFKILNGGYPINFDRTKEWESLEDIQLTRTLLYAGILQAMDIGDAAPGTLHELKNEWQDEIIKLWKKKKSYARSRN